MCSAKHIIGACQSYKPSTAQPSLQYRASSKLLMLHTQNDGLTHVVLNQNLSREQYCAVQRVIWLALDLLLYTGQRPVASHATGLHLQIAVSHATSLLLNFA